MKRILARDGNNFNFIRLVLASLVIFSHSFALVAGAETSEPLLALFGTLSLGVVGVDGFFLLSGFLIVRSWAQTPQIWPYLKKRALRIYPGFLVAFAVCVLIVGPLGSSAPEYFRQLKPFHLVLYALLLQEPTAPNLFPGQLHPVLNGSMWTIAYEFRCYLLAMGLGSIGLTRNKSLWLAATLLLIALHPFHPDVGSFGFPRSFYLLGYPGPLLRFTMLFMAGGCYFLFLPRIRFNGAMALLCAPIILLAMFDARIAEIALSVLGAYVLFWFAFSEISRLDRFKTYPDISYGVYLYGWPIQKLLLFYLPGLSPYPLFGCALVLSCICGYISWRAIEKPALQLKRRFPRDPRLLNA